MVNKVGHFHSPKVSSLKPTNGTGQILYNLYIFYLKSDKPKMCDFFRSLGLKIIADKLIESKNIYKFITDNEVLANSYAEAFDYFCDESVSFSSEYGCFIVVKDGQTVGYINEENFSTVRGVILTLNYISYTPDEVEVKQPTTLAEERWAQVQKYLAEQGNKTAKKNDTLAFGNMISKLCIISNSYNLTNVFDLTIFQLYDQYFQACYMHGIDFTESIVSAHGSKDFKYDNWLKPVDYYK